MAISRLVSPQRVRVGLYLLSVVFLLRSPAEAQAQSSELARTLGISFPAASPGRVILEKEGKRYEIDPTTKSIKELVPASASGGSTGGSDAAASALFAKNCAVCHGADASGNKAIGSPNFHDPAFQNSHSEAQISSSIHNGKGNTMPAWAGKLTEDEISSLVVYVKSFSGQTTGTAANQSSSSTVPKSETVAPMVYEAGDDLLISLPTGRPKQKGGVWVNFTHRFAYDPAFSGTGRGEMLFGLDGFALPAFGFTYGITDKLSASVYRAPSIIGRPIQLMAAYNVLDEHRQSPFNLALRFSVEGQNNFRQSYTENIEAIISRSITSRAQIYAVPTASFNDRRVVQGGLRSRDIPQLPGINAFSLGVGLAVDIRPTVALLAEVIPTLANGADLGIHRPAFAFGIQKKIYRHAFTLGFTTSPGTTVSQRAGTRASFIGDPRADKPSGLTIGFDLMRQIH